MAQNGILVSNEPYKKCAAITPDDSNDLAKPTDAIYVGTGGDAVIVGDDGIAATFVGLVAGAIYPIRARRVNATGTTAANLVALRWD